MTSHQGAQWMLGEVGVALLLHRVVVREHDRNGGHLVGGGNGLGIEFERGGLPDLVHHPPGGQGEPDGIGESLGQYRCHRHQEVVVVTAQGQVVRRYVVGKGVFGAIQGPRGGHGRERTQEIGYVAGGDFREYAIFTVGERHRAEHGLQLASGEGIGGPVGQGGKRPTGPAPVQRPWR